MKKYTAEQVSRILSAAANGELGSPSNPGNGTTYCIEQAALATWACQWFELKAQGSDTERGKAYDKASPLSKNLLRDGFWKDPDATLRWLEQQGMV